MLVPALLVAGHHPRLVDRGPLQPLEVQLAGVVVRPVLDGRGRGLGPGRHTLGPVLHAEGGHGAVGDDRPFEQVGRVLAAGRRGLVGSRSSIP